MTGAPTRRTEQVAGVVYLDGYRIRVTFRDGFQRDVDLTDELYGEVFEPLRNLEVFAAARFDEEAGTVVWPNGADLAPEFLRYGEDRPDCPCSNHEWARQHPPG